VIDNPPPSHDEQPRSELVKVTFEGGELLSDREPRLGCQFLGRIGGVASYIVEECRVYCPKYSGDGPIVPILRSSERSVQIVVVQYFIHIGDYGLRHEGSSAADSVTRRTPAR
jgi:hypothetical protein